MVTKNPEQLEFPFFYDQQRDRDRDWCKAIESLSLFLQTIESGTVTLDELIFGPRQGDLFKPRPTRVFTVSMNATLYSDELCKFLSNLDNNFRNPKSKPEGIMRRLGINPSQTYKSKRRKK